MRKYALKTIQALKPGDHLCCIYQTEREHRAVLTPFLRQGLERREKVRYIMDARTAEMILNYLRDDGLDIPPYLSSGQLGFLDQDETYLKHGNFDPDAMINLLKTETARALDEGYTGLRVTGEMTWALRGKPGSERLIEYEAKLNQFFPKHQCMAMCQYDRRQFDAAVLLDILRTHPVAVVGTEVYDNIYYIPPADMLSDHVEASELNHWIENLVERKRLDEALQHRIYALTSAEWDAEELRITDILDISQIQTLMELFYKATGIPVGILDLDGNVLVATGWRTICTKFHRVHPETAARCQESDAYIQKHLQEGKFVAYKCKNGLWDVALPIIIQGRHLATLFIGQFLYDDEKPDERYFRAQAQKHGFPEHSYMQALENAYSFSREQVRDIINYYAEFVHLLSELGHKNLALVHDIEARKRIEAELKSYREKLEDLVEERTQELRQTNEKLHFQAMLLEQIQDSIVATDLEGHITYVNKVAAQGWEKSQQELIGHTVSVFGENPEKGATQQEILAHTLEQGAWRGKVANYDQEESERIFDTRTWVVYDEAGNSTGLVGISTDITAQERAESDLQRYARDLELANAELSQYAYAVSHDLRAPLRAIRNYADFIQEELDPAKLKENLQLYLDGLTNAVEEADELVLDLLAFAHIGRTEIPEKQINVGEFLKQLIHKQSLSEDIDIIMQPGVWPTVTVAPLLLGQIFQNLIDNALKFNLSPRKRIELGWRIIENNSSTHEGNTEIYEFFVRDNGIGIEARHYTRIFRVFERLHTREEYEGTGIGLAIAQKAATHLGGTIYVDATVGEGSTFYVTLPKSPGDS